jgi:hypothetical protein
MSQEACIYILSYFIKQLFLLLFTAIKSFFGPTPTQAVSL